MSNNDKSSNDSSQIEIKDSSTARLTGEGSKIVSDQAKRRDLTEQYSLSEDLIKAFDRRVASVSEHGFSEEEALKMPSKTPAYVGPLYSERGKEAQDKSKGDCTSPFARAVTGHLGEMFPTSSGTVRGGIIASSEPIIAEAVEPTAFLVDHTAAEGQMLVLGQGQFMQSGYLDIFASPEARAALRPALDPDSLASALQRVVSVEGPNPRTHARVANVITLKEALKGLIAPSRISGSTHELLAWWLTDYMTHILAPLDLFLPFRGAVAYGCARDPIPGLDDIINEVVIENLAPEIEGTGNQVRVSDFEATDRRIIRFGMVIESLRPRLQALRFRLRAADEAEMAVKDALWVIGHMHFMTSSSSKALERVVPSSTFANTAAANELRANLTVVLAAADVLESGYTPNYTTTDWLMAAVSTLATKLAASSRLTAEPLSYLRTIIKHRTVLGYGEAPALVFAQLNLMPEKNASVFDVYETSSSTYAHETIPVVSQHYESLFEGAAGLLSPAAIGQLFDLMANQGADYLMAAPRRIYVNLSDKVLFMYAAALPGVSVLPVAHGSSAANEDLPQVTLALRMAIPTRNYEFKSRTSFGELLTTVPDEILIGSVDNEGDSIFRIGVPKLPPEDMLLTDGELVRYKVASRRSESATLVSQAIFGSTQQETINVWRDQLFSVRHDPTFSLEPNPLAEHCMNTYLKVTALVHCLILAMSDAKLIEPSVRDRIRRDAARLTLHHILPVADSPAGQRMGEALIVSALASGRKSNTNLAIGTTRAAREKDYVGQQIKMWSGTTGLALLQLIDFSQRDALLSMFDQNKLLEELYFMGSKS